MSRRRTLLGAQPINIQADEVDDEAEKRSNLQQQANSNSSVRIVRNGSKATPQTNGTPYTNRPSNAPVTPSAPKPSNEQLSCLYNNCIKLLNENKINQKNAFQLKLIDYLSDIVLNKDIVGNDTNFQVVGCTIDAGTKIYAARVDALHQNTYQVLSGLGYNNDENGDNQMDNNNFMDANENGGLNQSNNNDDGDNQKQKTQRKRRPKKSHLIENLEQITSKVNDELVDYDLYFSKISTAIEQEAIVGLLVNKLKYKDDNLEFLINRDDVYLDVKAINKDKIKDDNNTNEILKLKKLNECLRELVDKRISVELENFHFLGWDLSSSTNANGESNDPFATIIEQFNSNAASIRDQENTVDQDALEADRFDDNLNILENYDAGHVELSEFGGLAGPDAGDDFIDDIHDGLDQLPAMIDHGPNLNHIDDIQSMAHTLQDVGSLLETTLQPSDYTYFNFDRLRLHDLPKHLKAMAIKLATNEANSQNNANEGQDTTIRSKIAGKDRRKKQLQLLDLKQINDYTKIFKQTNKAICLSDKIIEKRAEKSFHLEIEREISYNPRQLFQLYSKTIPVKILTSNEIQNEFQSLIDDNVQQQQQQFNEENRQNNRYEDDGLDLGDHGPIDDDNFDIPPTADIQNNDFFTQGGGEFNLATQQDNFQANTQNQNIDEDYLIQAPEQVNAIHLEYAKTAKFIDAKKLKSALWSLICRHSSNKENNGDLNSSTINCSLKEIYPLLKPPLISQKAYDDLSVCIVFQMLLFLANEHNLRLVHNPDGSDVQITTAQIDSDKM